MERFGHGIAPTHGELGLAGLNRSQLLKFWRGIFQVQVKVVGENVEIAVVTYETAVYAAVIAVANAVEPRRIGHRQGA